MKKTKLLKDAYEDKVEKKYDLKKLEKELYEIRNEYNQKEEFDLKSTDENSLNTVELDNILHNQSDENNDKNKCIFENDEWSIIGRA